MKITGTEQINLQTLLIDIVEKVHHIIVIQIESFHHKIDIVVILEIDTGIAELLLPHNLIYQDTIIIDEKTI